MNSLTVKQIEFLQKFIEKYHLNDRIDNEQTLLQVLTSTLRRSNDNLQVYLDKLTELEPFPPTPVPKSPVKKDPSKRSLNDASRLSN